VAWGGAQALYEILPDLTCLGKIIGGGLPVGAYGGRRELMEQMAPVGPVYQAGTLSGNPLAVAAGLATLKILQEPDTYEHLEEKGRIVEEQVAWSAADSPLSNRVGSMFTLLPGPVWTAGASLKQIDSSNFFKKCWLKACIAAVAPVGSYLGPQHGDLKNDGGSKSHCRKS
jgi:glutamate-1-semialdehyde aminotransferase